MELLNAFSELNWWAVIVATLSSFVVGFVWYHKKVFGAQWMKLVGLSEEKVNSSEGMTKTFTLTGIASFLSAILLAMFMIALDINGFLGGLFFGAVVGAVFRLGTHVIHNGFRSQSDALTAIDGAHDIVALAVAGAILGMWM